MKLNSGITCPAPLLLPVAGASPGASRLPFAEVQLSRSPTDPLGCHPSHERIVSSNREINDTARSESRRIGRVK